MTSSPSNQEPTKILLLGAGELGLALLPHISNLPNVHLTIGIRSPGNYFHLVSSNISLIALDLTSASPALSQTFAAYDILISATGFTSTPGSVTKLAREVLQAGTLRKERGEGRLWFFPWQWGLDYDHTISSHSFMPLFGEQKRVRDLLRSETSANNVTWTVVSTGIFMSFLFEPFWGIVDRSREKEERGKVVVRCLRDWEHGVSVTDVNDIGRVLARILAGDVDGNDRILYVAGESIKYKSLADVVERVAGCEVLREAWSIEYLEEELGKDPEDGVKKYRLAFAGEGVWWEKERTVNHELGMEMVDVEAYAKKVFGAQR